jgi:circadian clock protein KaiA
LPTQLSICSLASSEALSTSLKQSLGSSRYLLNHFHSKSTFLEFLDLEKQQIDCLILQAQPSLSKLTNELHQRSTVLPAVIIYENLPEKVENSLTPLSFPTTEEQTCAVAEPGDTEAGYPTVFYHTAEVHISFVQISELARYIEQAISQFLNLSPSFRKTNSVNTADQTSDNSVQKFLIEHQSRLAEKLRERLGYLGVYYKRNPQRFLRNLPAQERKQFLDNLKSDYRDIILTYFANQPRILNQKIDEFVNNAFFADVSVTQIVEIHMNLMDAFSKQLKLEGRSEEILLDYRLTLIDIIAHLCEMYRRSIPRDS